MLLGRGWRPSPLSLRPLFLHCKGFQVSWCQERAEYGCSLCVGVRLETFPTAAQVAVHVRRPASRTSMPAAGKRCWTERTPFNLTRAPGSGPRRRSCVRVRALKSGQGDLSRTRRTLAMKPCRPPSLPAAAIRLDAAAEGHGGRPVWRHG